MALWVVSIANNVSSLESSRGRAGVKAMRKGAKKDFVAFVGRHVVKTQKDSLDILIKKISVGCREAHSMVLNGGGSVSFRINQNLKIVAGWTRVELAGISAEFTVKGSVDYRVKDHS